MKKNLLFKYVFILMGVAMGETIFTSCDDDDEPKYYAVGNSIMGAWKVNESNAVLSINGNDGTSGKFYYGVVDPDNSNKYISVGSESSWGNWTRSNNELVTTELVGLSYHYTINSIASDNNTISMTCNTVTYNFTLLFSGTIADIPSWICGRWKKSGNSDTVYEFNSDGKGKKYDLLSSGTLEIDKSFLWGVSDNKLVMLYLGGSSYLNGDTKGCKITSSSSSSFTWVDYDKDMMSSTFLKY